MKFQEGCPTFGENGWAFLSWGQEFLLGLLEICNFPVDEYLSPQGPQWGTWRGFVCWDF